MKSLTHKQLKKLCDTAWADLVKIRAGYKSEISGKTDKLHSHHLRGKSNYRLRYELENGVCCTSGEHFFGFHVAGRREQYEQIIFNKRRKGLEEYLEKLKWDICKTSLANVYIYLKSELKKYEQVVYVNQGVANANRPKK